MIESFEVKLVFEEREGDEARLVQIFDYILNLHHKELEKDKDKLYGEQSKD